MMNSRVALFSFALTAGIAGLAHAQKADTGTARKPDESIPKDYRPPPGMCRIWLERVPAKQQPAPTDCPSAVKNKPANGKVIFGDDYRDKGKKPEKEELPFLKKFTGKP